MITPNAETLNVALPPPLGLLTMVVVASAPLIVTDLVTLTSSLYVPALTVIV